MKKTKAFFLAGAALATLLFSGCAGGVYVPGPYAGPYYGGFGPYGDSVFVFGGGHHFYGRGFGERHVHFEHGPGGFHGPPGGFHGGFHGGPR